MATPDMLGWQYGKSVTECHRQMLETELGADICFEFTDTNEGSKGTQGGAVGGERAAEGGDGGQEGGKTTLVRAHRCMLMCRCTVFEQMLGGGKGGEGQGAVGQDGRIRVNDVQPAIFKEMLRFSHLCNSILTF